VEEFEVATGGQIQASQRHALARSGFHWALGSPHGRRSAAV